MTADTWVTIASLAGLIALAQQGGAMVMAATGAALVCLVPRSWREAGAEVPWPLVTVPVVVILGSLVYLGLAPQSAVGLGLIYLLAQRRLAALGPHDDRVSLVLSGLLFALAATRTDSPGFVLPLAVWIVALPMALLRLDLEMSVGRRPRRKDALQRARLPVFVVASTTALSLLYFVSLPRMGHHAPAPPRLPDPIFGEDGTAVTGVPTDEVRPGGVAELLDSDAEVFRVWFDEIPDEAIYFRAVSFSDWDGTTWRREDTTGAVVDETPVPEDALRVEVVVDNLKDGVLFTAGEVHAIEEKMGERFYPDVDGNVIVRRQGRASYTLISSPPFGPGAQIRPNRGDLTRYTEYPRLDPRVEGLVSDITSAHRDRRDKVDAIASYLRNAYGYTRVPGFAGTEMPLEWFLFDGKQGHCEYFATAMTLMARAANVPARFVNGYVGGETNPAGYLVFREAHAHAWTEVWLGDEMGWVMIDATPSGPGVPEVETTVVEHWSDAVSSWWYRSLLGYDGDDQSDVVIGAAERLDSLFPQLSADSGRPILGALGILLILSGLLAGAWQAIARLLDRLAGEAGPRPPSGAVAREHAKVRYQLQKDGWHVPTSLPPVAAAKWVLAREDSDAAEALLELAWLHYQVRYGGGDDGVLGGEAVELRQRAVRLGAPPM